MMTFEENGTWQMGEERLNRWLRGMVKMDETSGNHHRIMEKEKEKG